MKDLMDSKRKIQLNNEMDLAQLHAVLSEKIPASEFGEIKLKTGFLTKGIYFPKQDRVTPRISVKGNKVTITRITDNSSKSVSVGNVSFKLDKDLRGLSGVRTALDGSQYFKTVADAVTNALQGL